MKIILAFIGSLFILNASSQSIIYADILRADDRSSNFEILGTIDGDLLVYKNRGNNHKLTVYDNAMKVKDNVNLDFIPGRTFNLDFITYPDYFYAIYQYQKGNYVFCNAAKINASGKQVGETMFLDTTRLGFFADNKVYFVASSENKEHILLYKMQTKNDKILMSATLYDKNLKAQSITATDLGYDPRRESYGDFQVDNDGTFYFIKETSKVRNEMVKNLEIFYRRKNVDGLYVVELPINENKLFESNLKIDNKNNRLFITSYFYGDNVQVLRGIHAIALQKDSLKEIVRNHAYFSDSISTMLSRTGSGSRAPFDNFVLKNVLAKSDKGLLLTLENVYSEDRGFYNNRYNRFGYNDPFGYRNNNFYQFQRGYYDNYYWPYSNRYNSSPSTLYNNNDVIMLNLNDSLKVTWESIINKTQSAIETDNYLSFSNIIQGGAIHYLYLLKDNNKEVVSNDALLPDGRIERLPTIKGGEKGFLFMPRLAKQISNNAVIIPGTFRNRIGFAKVILN